MDERLGELDALAHAGGVASHLAVAGLEKSDVAEDFCGALASGVAGEAAHLGHVPDEFGGGHVEREAVVLGHVADVLAEFSAVGGDIEHHASQAEGRGFESLLPLQSEPPYVWPASARAIFMSGFVDHLLTWQRVQGELRRMSVHCRAAWSSGPHDLEIVSVQCSGAARRRGPQRAMLAALRHRNLALLIAAQTITFTADSAYRGKHPRFIEVRLVTIALPPDWLQRASAGLELKIVRPGQRSTRAGEIPRP